MAVNKPVAIEKNLEDYPLTFAFLRKHGIELAQQFSGNIWTDFNLHDPGVTMLEQLCFAITDLSYRTEFSIEDMLADENGLISRKTNSFIKTQQVLTTKPISIIDYRKYAMDSVAELKNVWIDTHATSYSRHYMKGIYRVTVQIDEAYKSNEEEQKNEEEIKLATLKTLEQVRNLCEDFNDIVALKQQLIIVNAEIIITSEQPAEEILANILFTLNEVTNPSLKYFTEKELIEKGYTIEQIYNGPLLKNGIIPDSQMRQRRTQIDLTDFVNAIIGIKGVESVSDIRMTSNNKNYFDEPCILTADHYPILNSETFLDTVQLYKNKFKVHLEKDKFLRFYEKIKQQSKREFISSLHEEEKEGQLLGQYRNVDKYYSIQDHFPLIYGIGQEGILSSKPAAEQAKAAQLKAYLMLFEQVLANYLAQLKNIPNLYTPYVSGQSHSYYFQPLYDVPNIAKILKSYTEGSYKTSDKKDWLNFTADNNNGYVQHLSTGIEADDEMKQRKNKMMDHLLARFNISLNSYGVVLFNQYYNNADSSQEMDMVLTWKAAILQQINEIIHDRSRARSYYELETDTARNFQKNIYLFLSINNETGKRIALSFYNSEVKMTNTFLTPDSNLKIITANNTREDIIEVPEKYTNPGNAEDAEAIIWEQPISFLATGLNYKMYKVLSDVENKDKFILLFKNIITSDDVKEIQWKVIGRYASEAIAFKMMDETIAAIKKISLDTEGFHAVEHILLRPPLSSSGFGFQFIDKDNRVLFTQKDELTFAERERIIGDLLLLPSKYDTRTNQDLLSLNNDNNANRLTGQILINFEQALLQFADINYKLTDPDDKKNKLLKEINYNLNAFNNKQMESFPMFRYSVKVNEELTINEEFYNYRISYVFPSWPARFQNIGFRSFAENLLKEYSPIQIQSAVYWLNQAAIAIFEEDYFAWWENLKIKNRATNEEISRTKLTVFLAKAQYIIQPL